MPVFTGTSIPGIQGIGNYSAVASTWVAVDFTSFDTNQRLDRIGLLIVGATNPSGRVQVVEVFKLFGNGVFVLPRYPILPFTYNLSIQWFRPGIPWLAQTP